MSRSKKALYFSLAFIFGVFLGSVFNFKQVFFLAIIVSAIFIISVFYKFEKAAVLGFCILFLVFGMWRANSANSAIYNNDFIKNNLYGKTMQIEGVISKEPDVREKSMKLLINGNILITAGKYPEYKYKDKILVSGKIEIPPVFEDFNYKDYLEKDGIYAVMSFPKIQLMQRPAFPGIYGIILSVKDKMRKGIESDFPVMQASVLKGMILGDNAALSDNLKNKMNITGLRHIIAISGTHVVILSSILMSFLLAIGLWRGQAFYGSVFLITLYIILAGAPASGIRSGIMAVIVLLGQKIGRKSANKRIIFIACALMLAFNPLLLLHDVGFQLSFLASLGIIYVCPIISSFIPIKRFPNLKEMLCSTLSAQISTLAIIIYNFGTVSLIAPVSNLFALPAVYWLMVFGFISAFLGVLPGFISWIFSFPAWVFTSYFLKVADFFSNPVFSQKIENVSVFWLFAFYIILIIFIRYFNEKQRLKFLNY